MPITQIRFLRSIKTCPDVCWFQNHHVNSGQIFLFEDQNNQYHHYVRSIFSHPFFLPVLWFYCGQGYWHHFHCANTSWICLFFPIHLVKAIQGANPKPVFAVFQNLVNVEADTVVESCSSNVKWWIENHRIANPPMVQNQINPSLSCDTLNTWFWGKSLIITQVFKSSLKGLTIERCLKNILKWYKWWMKPQNLHFNARYCQIDNWTSFIACHPGFLILFTLLSLFNGKNITEV